MHSLEIIWSNKEQSQNNIMERIKFVPVKNSFDHLFLQKSKYGMGKIHS